MKPAERASVETDYRRANAGGENLRQRAYLNTVASWAEMGVKLAVSFVLNPLVVATLGPVFYGVWQILGQLNSYMVMSDLRAATTLKWAIAKDRTIATGTELRQSVTAALLAMLLVLPFYVVAGCLVVWLAPHVSRVESLHFSTVRATSALLVLGFVFTQFLFIFDSVLMGMNLSYKAMGVRPLANVAGGALTAAALWFGWGMPGMAAVLVVVTLLSGAMIGRIVCLHVPWFGFARVSWATVVGFVKLTGWFMALKIVDTVNLSTDVILLGYLAGPRLVSAYAISRYLMTGAATLCNTAWAAVVPGVSKFIGEKDYRTLLSVRRQVLSLLWAFLTAAGVTVCVCNRSFVGLWTRPEYFAGTLETFLIVALVVVKSIQNVDASIVLMALEVRRNVWTGAIAAAITVGLAWVLVPLYQTAGLLAAMLAGALTLSLGYSYNAAVVINRGPVNPNLFQFFLETYLTRTPLVCIGLLCTSGFLASRVHLTSWVAVLLAAAAVFSAASAFLWAVGLDAASRKRAVDNAGRLALLGRG